MICLPSMLLAKVGSAVSCCRLKSPGLVLYPCISSFRTATWSTILYICSRIDGVFLSYEAFGFNVILIRGRQELWSPKLGLRFGCCPLLPTLALCLVFWDTKDAASQLPELFSRVHIMSGLSVFSCDLGSIGCAVSKWTAAKWLSDYISGFCS